MALTTVRARLGETWVTLAYNDATGRYEGTLTPSGTSAGEPGGYFSVTVEAVNAGGETASASGESLASLRLAVRETVSPVLTLVSPSPGYVTSKRPTVLADAVDEAGGSGVDPGTFSVLLDGAAQAEGLAYEAIEGGYRLSWTPAADLSDGPHVVTFAVSDRDGNPASASAAYTVDTVPPALRLTRPDSHRIVDAAAIEVAGVVTDTVSGVASVTVGGVEADVMDGSFHRLVPLEIGINEITVTAADAAGLTAGESFRVLRLVTDRSREDAERVRELCERGYSRWTEEERAWWAGTRCRRGSYDAQDLSRVNTAIAWLDAWLREYGYLPQTQPDRRTWAEEDVFDLPAETRLVRNTAALRAVLPLEEAPEAPETVRDLLPANRVEEILVAVDAVRPMIDRSYWTCGEISCGE